MGLEFLRVRVWVKGDVSFRVWLGLVLGLLLVYC